MTRQLETMAARRDVGACSAGAASDGHADVGAAVTLRTATEREAPVCEVCGLDLSTRRRGIRCCSARCRMAAMRARRRAGR